MIYVALGCRCLIGIVFAISAASKLRNRAAFTRFASWLAGLPALPLRGRRTAAAVALGETAVVVLVGLPWTVADGLLLATLALAVLAAGAFLVARSGASEPCQCFGVSTEPLGFPQVIRNVVLCGVAATGAVGAALAGSATLRPAGAALALWVALAVALCTVYLEDLVGFFTDGGAAPASSDPWS
jgi:hypothetical protein